MTGIGFLGAGTIIKEGLTIRGLTTAACLWLIAAVGMAAGAGYLLYAVLTTLIALNSLLGLDYLERFYPKDSYRILTIETPSDIYSEDLIKLIVEKDVRVVFVEFHRDYESCLKSFKLHVHIFHKGLTDLISRRMIEKNRTDRYRIEENRRGKKIVLTRTINGINTLSRRYYVEGICRVPDAISFS